MEDLGKNIFKYDKVEFLPAVMEKKNDGYRLGQACCAFADDIFHVSYSFCKGQELVHFRLEAAKDECVPSISHIYSCAVFYENEMAELFGLNIEQMETDYKNKLYRINETTPFMEKEDK